MTGVVGAAALTPASAATSTNPVSSRLAELKNALSGLVTDGTLTQAQADKVATTLDSMRPDRHRGGRHGGLRREIFAQEAVAAAKTLGLTPAQLRAQLQSGKSLAQVAAAQKISVTTLVDALVAVAKDQLAVDVKAGRLTQARADTISAGLRQRITDHVSHVRSAGGPDGSDGRGGPDGHDGRGGTGADGADEDGPDGPPPVLGSATPGSTTPGSTTPGATTPVATAPSSLQG